MTVSTKTEFLAITGLLTLSLIPIAAGTSRLVQIVHGVQITPENARFIQAPLPVTVHILSASVYCVLGAFQFSPSIRRLKPYWHRASGRLLIPCGLIAALSGLWMTLFYPTGGAPPASFDGPYLYAIRVLVALGMTLFLLLGYSAVRRRNIKDHRAWMMRGYALGIGAGTQALTHIPWFLFPSIQGELARTIFMGAGWAINLVLAQWLSARWSE